MSPLLHTTPLLGDRRGYMPPQLKTKHVTYATFFCFSLGIANADTPHLTASLWLYCGAHGMRVWLPVFPREVKTMLNLKLYELNNYNLTEKIDL